MKYINCPACGGKIHFDIGLQKIKCEFCDSEFDPKEIGELTGADEESMSAEEASFYDSSYEGAEAAEEEVTVFSCPSCGAQVTGEDISAVEYCQYCGSFVTFKSRIEKIRRPDYIAPFAITRERCKEIYKKRIKSTLYVPKDLKRDDSEVEFHPMFIPFWNMEVEYSGSNTMGTHEEWRQGNYDCSRDYDVEFESEGKFTNCLFDASKALDDNISDCIGDYDPAKLVDYNPSFMHGAFADMADVEANVYHEEAKERCFISLGKNVREAIEYGEESYIFHNAKRISFQDSSRVNPSVSSKLSMFPVWFMTYRNKDRVAYAVVNGQTGSIFTETPVDLVKFFIVSLIMALPLYFMLESLATFRPTTMLGFISIFSAVVLIMYTVIAGDEWNRDHRVPGERTPHEPDDIADTENSKNKHHKNKHHKNKQRNSGSRFAKIIMGLVFSNAMIFLIGVVLWAEADLPIFAGIRIFALIAVLVAVALRYKKFDKPGRSMLIRETIWGIIAILITIVFKYYDPVYDWYYYAAAIIAMIGMITSILFVVKRYNRRVTRPVPHFFNGKEGEIA